MYQLLAKMSPLTGCVPLFRAEEFASLQRIVEVACEFANTLHLCTIHRPGPAESVVGLRCRRVYCERT